MSLTQGEFQWPLTEARLTFKTQSSMVTNSVVTDPLTKLVRITESSEHFPIRGEKKRENKWSRVITLSEDASNLFGQLSLLSRGTSLLAKKVKAQPKLCLETAAQKYDRESSMMRNCAIQCLLCAHELATTTQRRADGASPASRPRNPIQAT